MDEEEEKTRLTPVKPKDPELWTVATPRGTKKTPHRSSRRLKFLGLVEKGSKDIAIGDREGFVHGRELYDLAFGPNPPRSRRPLESEWADPFLGETETEALQQVAKKRKDSKKKRTRGPNKKKTD